ncbi:hypothetical protein C3Y87_19360 [Carbonactinospora thermoautotrophica]|nr:hypothetical protein [Carbonactinospora thermoautotrophica]
MGQAPRPLTPHLSPRHFFGAELRYWREQRGLSQAALDRLIHFGEDTICKVEKAVRWPPPGLAEACDQALGTGGVLAHSGHSSSISGQARQPMRTASPAKRTTRFRAWCRTSAVSHPPRGSCCRWTRRGACGRRSAGGGSCSGEPPSPSAPSSSPPRAVAGAGSSMSRAALRIPSVSRWPRIPGGAGRGCSAPMAAPERVWSCRAGAHWTGPQRPCTCTQHAVEEPSSSSNRTTRPAWRPRCAPPHAASSWRCRNTRRVTASSRWTGARRIVGCGSARPPHLWCRSRGRMSWTT